jgi:copper(I)-binding protein
MVQDAYARAASPAAKAGAAFMMLMNTSDQDDRLIGVQSDAAKRVELHTHIDKGDGIMQMTEIEGGIALPAGEMHMMQRGGDHVMLMGLNGPLVQGESIEVTLIFEHAGEVVIEIEVDNEHKGTHGSMDHKSD